MKKMIALALISGAFYACSEQKSTESSTAADTAATAAAQPAGPTLTKVWETDTVLTTVESTLYHPEGGMIYTSNIEGKPNEKDKKGSISRLKPDGTVSDLRWVSGLNAPKGMAILNSRLYVTDVDELVEISLDNAKVVKRYPVAGAKFLNDAATDGKNVYFSDMQTGKIHMLENGKVTTTAEGMESINGLAFSKGGDLFLLDAKGMRKYNRNDKSATAVNEVVTGGDGLVVIDDSTFIASRWKGEVYLIRNGKEQLLLDTQGESSNTADIDYIPEQKLLLVPTFMKNRVAAYRLDY